MAPQAMRWRLSVTVSRYAVSIISVGAVTIQTEPIFETQPHVSVRT